MLRKKSSFIFKCFYDNAFTLQSSTRIAHRSVHTYSTNDKEHLTSSLSSIVGINFVKTSKAVCEQHSHDESYHLAKVPEIVVLPNSVEEVSEVAKVCSSYKIPMVPFGTGTGLEGGVAPLRESVCVNLTNMNEIFNLNVEDFDVHVKSGVTRKQLNYELRSTGLWYPVDPGADASLCGMAATGASGTNSVRYGTMKQNVLNLEVVLADGTILHTGGKNRHCRKSSAGYNLTELFVGSEGTLGFITSATLRLHAVPEKTMVAICSFLSVTDAVTTATQVLQCGIPIARIEFLDSTTITAVNAFSKLNHPIKPTLFLEFHGSETSAQEQVDRTNEIAIMNNGSDFQWSTTQEEINRLWQARHDVLYAVNALKPGSKAYSTDVCVPMSALASAIEYSVSVLEETGITHGILGHVGDGNFHCLLVLEEDEYKAAQNAAEKIGKKSIELGGTCTGEHGIGIGKKKLLQEEVGLNGIAAMRLVKNALDPNNLMNPGKVL